MSVRYFANTILPVLLKAYNAGSEQQSHLTDLYYIRSTYASHPEYINWKNISIEHHPISENKSVGLYNFDTNQNGDALRYGLIFFNYDPLTANYYQLELNTTQGEQNWHIFLINPDESKIDYGALPMLPTAKNFIDYVVNHFEEEI